MESDCRGFAGLENRSVEGVAFVKLELRWIVVKPPKNVVLAPLTLFERQELWERLINQHSGRVEAILEQEVVALTPTLISHFHHRSHSQQRSEANSSPRPVVYHISGTAWCKQSWRAQPYQNLFSTSHVRATHSPEPCGLLFLTKLAEPNISEFIRTNVASANVCFGLNSQHHGSVIFARKLEMEMFFVLIVFWFVLEASKTFSLISLPSALN